MVAAVGAKRLRCGWGWGVPGRIAVAMVVGWRRECGRCGCIMGTDGAALHGARLRSS